MITTNANGLRTGVVADHAPAGSRGVVDAVAVQAERGSACGQRPKPFPRRDGGDAGIDRTNFAIAQNPLADRRFDRDHRPNPPGSTFKIVTCRRDR